MMGLTGQCPSNRTGPHQPAARQCTASGHVLSPRPTPLSVTTPAPVPISKAHTFHSRRCPSSTATADSHMSIYSASPSCHNRLLPVARATSAPSTVSSPQVGPRTNANLGTPLTEQQLQAQIRSQVVQIRTLHRLPNYKRPWETGASVQSSSTAFVVDPARRLLMTTAGAVEGARRVMVSRADGSDGEVAAQVVAVCEDADVALLMVGTGPYKGGAGGARGPAGRGGRAVELRGVRTEVEGEEEGEEGEDVWDDEEGEEEEEGEGPVGRRGRGRGATRRGGRSDEDRFWSGMRAVRWGPLPGLQEGVRVAGYPIGGESLAVTSGVVSRCEVVEYSHGNRNLLALQVDAPLNNGVWGGPLYDAWGRVRGMAFQKFTSQTWMERYDEEGLDALDLNIEGDEEEEESLGGGGGGGGVPEGDDDEEAENVGYCIPSLLLEHVLQDWEESQRRGGEEIRRGEDTQDVGEITDMDDVMEDEESENISTRPGTSSCSPRSSVGGGGGSGGGDSSSIITSLEGFPVLALRWQSLESPALRAHLGMMPDESGVRMSVVDQSGSAAGVLQTGDVLVKLGSYKVANDGTVLLRPAQRVLFGHAASSEHVGGMLPVEVIRDGKRLKLMMRLVHAPGLVPTSLGHTRPLYLILGGAVLLQLSLPYLYTVDMPKAHGRRLKRWSFGHLGVNAALEWGMPTHEGAQEVIICSELLSGSVVHEGYGVELGGCMRRLESVNGERVVSMAHLVNLVLGSATEQETEQETELETEQEQGKHSDSAAQQQGETGRSTLAAQDLQPQEVHGEHGSHTHGPTVAASTIAGGDSSDEAFRGFLRLGFSDGSLMVLDRRTLREDTIQALSRQGIGHAMSGRLRALLPDEIKGWPAKGGVDGTPGPAVQKRQQRRRRSRR